MALDSRVVRDNSWIDREYGREKWPSLLARIRQELAEGETSLSRIIANVRRMEYGLGDGGDKEVTIGGARRTLPRAFALHGGIGATLETLIDAARDAEAIIELGSGWGYNLFHLWLNGGPRTARYYALEYTEAGRTCSEILAALQPDLAMTSLPFDYYDVDLSGLGRFAGKVFVFTLYSVDQIPRLPPAIFSALAELSPSVTGLHIEPVGWQMSKGRRLGSSRAYAEKHDYNRDLWPLLCGLREEGMLTIDEASPLFYGRNPDNSGALIRWSSGRRTGEVE